MFLNNGSLGSVPQTWMEPLNKALGPTPRYLDQDGVGNGHCNKWIKAGVLDGLGGPAWVWTEDREESSCCCLLWLQAPVSPPLGPAHHLSCSKAIFLKHKPAPRSESSPPTGRSVYGACAIHCLPRSGPGSQKELH